MKIRSAVPKNGCLIVLVDGKKQKNTKKNKKNICKTYTHPRHTGSRLRKKTCSDITISDIHITSNHSEHMLLSRPSHLVQHSRSVARPRVDAIRPRSSLLTDRIRRDTGSHDDHLDEKKILKFHIVPKFR